VVGLAEYGTHAIAEAEIGADDERELARALLFALELGMLVVADRAGTAVADALTFDVGHQPG
jgi:hypothetical protein